MFENVLDWDSLEPNWGPSASGEFRELADCGKPHDGSHGTVPTLHSQRRHLRHAFLALSARSKNCRI